MKRWKKKMMKEEVDYIRLVNISTDSPISPLDENLHIDFSLVYALHTFVATLEGQVYSIHSHS
jgi:hypothetical protein